MSKISLNNLSHSYLAQQNNDLDWALRDIDLEWSDGGAYALLGPSGCGKTCLLYTSPSPRDLSTSRMPSSA